MRATNTHANTVFVGLSGGVDSSVAALRLKQQGYEVVGVFIKVWHPDWLICNWEQERLDAMRVAAHLEIPFLTCDAEEAYKHDVADYLIGEYQAGRTPNPDVMCNQHVKFGRFLAFAREHGAAYIATGHYAKRVESSGGDGLHRGVDTEKDQSYFLWTLSNEQLFASLFPIGDTPKASIRLEAEQHSIPVAAKKDSQGVCFLGHIDIAEFLSHYVDVVPGDVLNTAGAVIGSHRGALVYTIGQRHGFTTEVQADQHAAQYVVDRDLSKNTITVAPSLETITTTQTIELRNVVLRSPICAGDTVQYQIRYRQTPLPGTIKKVTDSTLVLTPTEALTTPASGQSCVLYQDTLCLGGGIIA